MVVLSIQYKYESYDITGGPLDMLILELVKTRISGNGKSHIENQKVVIPYVHDFSLICEIKITFCSCLFTY